MSSPKPSSSSASPSSSDPPPSSSRINGKSSSSHSKKSAPLDDRTRLKRNAGEKKRRDKLNNYISELSAMVPSCRMPQSQRKLDKSTILKLTVSYMKLHADLLPESLDDKNLSWKPSFLSNEELGQLMLEALDGFLFVIWSTGRTIYISESITPLLGHLQQDLVGKNFLELIHPDDIAHVKEKMFPADGTEGYIEESTTASSPGSQSTGCGSSTGTPSPGSAPSPSSTTSDTPTHLRRHFQARIRRGGFQSKSDYEQVYCSGHLRKWDEVIRNSPVESAKCEPLPQDGFCLVGVGRLQFTQTIREMTPGAPPLNSWTSHHSLDAKYLYLDQSAPSIIGYTPAELLGSSAYNLYHDEDLNGLARSHINLNNTGSGLTCLYRFLTKGQQWLWIKTQGTIRYRDGTKEPNSIVCQNIVVSYAEVWQYLQNKSRQYGPDEPKMLMPSPTGSTSQDLSKSEVTLDDIKVEQFSPGSGIAGTQYSAPYYNTSPVDPTNPAFRGESSSYTTVRPEATSYTTVPDQDNTAYRPTSTFYPNNNTPNTQPNFVQFQSTTYFNPHNNNNPLNNNPHNNNPLNNNPLNNNPLNNNNPPAKTGTFDDLYPNFKPSISTLETHGRYRPLGGGGGGGSGRGYTATTSPPCQYQQKVPDTTTYHPVTTQYEDVKPVYIQQQQQTQQQPSFLQTIGSPPPHLLNPTIPHTNHNNMVPPSPHPNIPPNVLITTANVVMPTTHANVIPSTHIATPSNAVMVTSAATHTPVMEHHGAPRGVMQQQQQQPPNMTSQPASMTSQMHNYVPHHGVMVQSNQIPNVTIRSGGITNLMHAEEPVVGMPVLTGYNGHQQQQLSPHHQQQQPSPHNTHHIIGNNILKQSESPPPKKGVSVYGGPEKRPARSLNLNSCAQMTHKRVRSDSPQNFPPYIKPATPAPYHHIPYNTPYTPYTPSPLNGYNHSLAVDELKHPSQLLQQEHVVYQSIDTGQPVQPAKQT